MTTTTGTVSACCCPSSSNILTLSSLTHRVSNSAFVPYSLAHRCTSCLTCCKRIVHGLTLETSSPSPALYIDVCKQSGCRRCKPVHCIHSPCCRQVSFLFLCRHGTAPTRIPSIEKQPSKSLADFNSKSTTVWPSSLIFTNLVLPCLAVQGYSQD